MQVLTLRPATELEIFQQNAIADLQKALAAVHVEKDRIAKQRDSVTQQLGAEKAAHAKTRAQTWRQHSRSYDYFR